MWETSCLLALRPRAFDSGPSHQPSAKPLAGVSLTSPPGSVAAHTRTHRCVPRGPQARSSSLSRWDLDLTNQKIQIKFLQKTRKGVGSISIPGLTKLVVIEIFTDKATLNLLKTGFQIFSGVSLLHSSLKLYIQYPASKH